MILEENLLIFMRNFTNSANSFTQKYANLSPTENIYLCTQNMQFQGFCHITGYNRNTDNNINV